MAPHDVFIASSGNPDINAKRGPSGYLVFVEMALYVEQLEMRR